MSERIDIYCDLSYVSIDSAIESLIKLRDEYGSDCVIDIELEPVPYEDREQIAINLIVKGR